MDVGMKVGTECVGGVDEGEGVLFVAGEVVGFLALL